MRAKIYNQQVKINLKIKQNKTVIIYCQLINDKFKNIVCNKIPTIKEIVYLQKVTLSQLDCIKVIKLIKTKHN